MTPCADCLNLTNDSSEDLFSFLIIPSEDVESVNAAPDAHERVLSTDKFRVREEERHSDSFFIVCSDAHYGAEREYR